MGFEQLAALKAQLAKQAQAAPRKSKAGAESATPGKPSKVSKPAKAGQPGKPAKATQPGKSAKASQPAKPTKPVDPVVLVIAQLQRRFPKAFPKNPAPKVPLKVGIFEDALQQVGELGITEAELRDAIRTWCRGTRYWVSMTAGAPRLDLAGQPAGEVSEADAKRAQRLQANRTARAAAREAKPEAKPAAMPDAKPDAKPDAEPNAESN